ncbi:hypothetical protein LCI18_002739 [Fusarium solani-melongenae]|uniref:Uncharacterized protein n=1 Tax=Fusarium solani subsp. cucurbitae TaxID=2747967 RepID=A0ACD3YS41_FUSSC|nr:hypothetical protein LCI18_002739 [Fusarium solani-melongenae]
MDCCGIDGESLMLAIQLQRQDLDEYEHSKKGKHREDEIIDSEVALEACRKELEEMAAFLSDQAFCISIARAVESDALLIAEAKAAEEQAASDRAFALRLSGNPKATPGADTTKANEKKRPADHLDDASIERFKLMNRFAPDHAESSCSAASREPTETRECIACTDSFPPPALSRSPCSHEYCRGCLIGLVNSSLRDESLFPPRCCTQPIPIETGPWFSPTLVGEFRAKQLEHDTPNRTYCSEPTCSTFVPPAFISEDVALCPKCSKRTCVHCKGPFHHGICPSDTVSQQFLELATQNGWQQCKVCKRVVELEQGCNHITTACKCKAEFCYVCGKRWKTCSCPQWHEERLYCRANAIVDRANDAAQLNEAVRQRRVEQERLNLIENHECTHERWKGRPGPRECEECLEIMPVFIYECRRCRIMACRRCRYNRL